MRGPFGELEWPDYDMWLNMAIVAFTRQRPKMADASEVGTGDLIVCPQTCGACYTCY